jgi:phosphoribosylformylglycinamidine (FGAM) synthase-like enzyme
MLLIIMSVYLKLKVKNTHKIARKINRIKEDMKLEDFKILTKLLESSPNFINYSELSDVYSEHLGYESKKKKTRQSISSLEEYLTQKLKIKYPVFEFRKNKEDKREKQIRII